MIFHENRHEISSLIFFKIRKMSQKLSSAAVVVCPLSVNFGHSECRNVNACLFVYRIQYVYMVEKEAGFMYMI